MKKNEVKFPPIKFEELRVVFFPKNFHEKYSYLGCIPRKEDVDIFKAVKPLVLIMDLKAKPFWCPRWVLRLFNLLGNDNSIVRVRNIKISNLFSKLTKKYRFYDYKTKWSDYDLRISIAGDEELFYLSDSIEEKFYNVGRKDFLKQFLSKRDPKTDYNYYSLKELEMKFEELSPKY